MKDLAIYDMFSCALRHLTQGKGVKKALSKALGVAPATIYMASTGSRRVSLKMQERIANQLGYPYDEFLRIGRIILHEGTYPETYHPNQAIVKSKPYSRKRLKLITEWVCQTEQLPALSEIFYQHILKHEIVREYTERKYSDGTVARMVKDLLLKRLSECFLVDQHC